jgi:hypothetical protein
MVCLECGKANVINGCLGFCSRCYARDLRRRKRIKTKKCICCGRAFDTPRRDALYCSNICRQKRYRDRQSIPAVMAH